MPRGAFTTVIGAVAVALFVVALVGGVTQTDPGAGAADDVGDASPSDDEPLDAPSDETSEPVAGDAADDTTGSEPAEDAGEEAVEDEPVDVPSDELGQLSVVTSFGGIAEGGGDIRFDVTITNSGDTVVAVQSADITLVGPGGPLDTVDDPDATFDAVELVPGDSANGAIVFAVPSDSTGLVLRVAPPDTLPVEIRL